MKGLLLKDLYMTSKYCKMYLIVAVMFIALAFASKDSFFLSFYPCLISAMLPVTLLGYDERSKWNEYCGALPYSKAQIVSEKYIIGLSAQALMIILSGASQAVKMKVYGCFDMKEYLLLMSLMISLSLVSSSITLPFMFRYGVEKGRIAYYIMIGAGCGGSLIISDIFTNDLLSGISQNVILTALCLAAAAIYAVSWYLSVVFYKKREDN